MSSDGGQDELTKLGKGVDTALQVSTLGIVKNVNDFANLATNYFTGGLLGYDTSTGRINPKQGFGTRLADETLGEITGRNLQREELAKADARVNAEALQRERDLANQRSRDELLDRSASSAAQGIRNTARAASSGRGSYGGSSLGAEQDFLGL